MATRRIDPFVKSRTPLRPAKESFLDHILGFMSSCRCVYKLVCSRFSTSAQVWGTLKVLCRLATFQSSTLPKSNGWLPSSSCFDVSSTWFVEYSIIQQPQPESCLLSTGLRSAVGPQCHKRTRTRGSCHLACATVDPG